MRRFGLTAKRLLPFCALLTLSFSIISLLRADEPNQRIAVPSAAKQSEAEQRIRSVFKAEYADRAAALTSPDVCSRKQTPATTTQTRALCSFAKPATGRRTPEILPSPSMPSMRSTNPSSLTYLG